MKLSVTSENIEPNVQAKAKFVSLILIGGFIVAIILIYVQGHIQGLGYPFDTFLFHPNVIFKDFDLPLSIANNPYHPLVDSTGVDNNSQVASNTGLFPEIIASEFWVRNSGGPLYFPFAYWVISLFRFFPVDLAKLLFLELSISLFALLCFLNIYKQAGLFYTAVIFFLSYPFLFLLDRGNFEIFVFFFLYVFIFFYHRKPTLAMIALACAIAMKLSPAFLLLIYLSDRKYRETLYTLLIAGLLNIIGYWLYPGGLVNNIYVHLLNLRISSLYYLIDGRDSAFSHSLLTMLKYLGFSLLQRPNAELVSGLASRINSLINPIVVVIVSAWCIFVEKELWKKVALATCLMLLVPPTSADYRLINLYIPFFIWLNITSFSRFDWLYAILYGALFIPKSYYHSPVLPEMSIAVFLNPLLMLCLILTIIVEGVAEKQLASFFDQVKSALQYKHGTRKRTIAIAGLSLIGCLGILFLLIGLLQNKSSVSSATITRLHRYGEQAEQQSKWVDAFSYYSQWVILQPDEAVARFHLADNELRLSFPQAAYNQFQYILWFAYNTLSARSRAETGLLSSLELSTIQNVNLRQFEQARLLLDQHQKYFPDVPVPIWLTCLVDMQWKPEDWSGGLDCYKNILRLSPYDTEKLIRNFGQNRAAMLIMANKWLSNSPQDAQVAYQFLGWNHYFNKEYPQAIDSFIKALAIGSDKSSYYGLTRALLASNRPVQVCSALRKWEEIDPGASEKLGITASCSESFKQPK